MNPDRHPLATPPRPRLLVHGLAVALALGAAGTSPEAGASAARAKPSPTTSTSLAEVLAGYGTLGLLPTAAPPSLAPGATLAVLNCNDAGSGSLREALAAANDNDVIDMSGLACSKITLTTGALSTSVANVSIVGAGAEAIEVSGNDNSRVLWHLGSGTLRVEGVTLSHGSKYLADADLGNAAGGCVFSNGSVTLKSSRVTHCAVGTDKAGAVARGGGIWAKNAIRLDGSELTLNQARSSVYQARGGGAYTEGTLSIANSLIAGNKVQSPGASTGGGVQNGSRREQSVPGGTSLAKYSVFEGNDAGSFGGAAYLTGTPTILKSTVSGNAACRGGGLYFVVTDSTSAPAMLSSSTISGNEARCQDGAGGVAAFGMDLTIEDSTVAFNRSTAPSESKYGVGVQVTTANHLQMQNSIIANNVARISGTNLIDDLGGNASATAGGSNNLVQVASTMPAPPGTIQLTDPMLRPLANNGGRTPTHMPNFGSPVIDVGNNVSGASTDQRGTGSPRVRNGTADIGAIEFDLPERIFRNGFD